MKRKKVARVFVIWLILKLVAAVLRVIAIRKVEQIHREKFPQGGPLMAVCHHLTTVEEFGILFHLLWKKVHIVFKDELGKGLVGRPFVGPFLRLSGMIQTKRGKTGTAKVAEDQIRSVLEDGGIAMAAPERTSRHKGLIRAKGRGLARIAIDLDCPVLPIAVHNATGALVNGILYYLRFIPGIGGFFRKRVRQDICVVYGTPIRLRSELKIDYQQDPEGLEGQTGIDAIMIRIGALLREDLRGEYTDEIAAFLQSDDPDADHYRKLQPLVNQLG